MPQIADGRALLLAVGIIGATVMPHAIYLHSGLTQARMPVRDDADRRKVLRFSNQRGRHRARGRRPGQHGHGDDGLERVPCRPSARSREIETAYHTLTPLLGGAAAGVFLLSLIASGISSSTVGTMAGQMIMQGFVGFRIPVWLRRLVTMVPAFVVVALGVNATQALVISQVVLSIALPLPMISLLMFTSRRHHGPVRQQQTHARCRGDRDSLGARAQCLADLGKRLAGSLVPAKSGTRAAL